MNYAVYIIFTLSIFIAGVISIVRFKAISKIYYPFLYCIWVACLNEMLSVFIMNRGYYTSVNNNIYVLIESLLIVYFFKKAGVLKKSNSSYFLIFFGLLSIWVIENIILKKITLISVYFRIVYSFIIVLFSITTINKLTVTVRKNLFKNSTFLMCIGFIIYFTYKVLVEAFWLYGLNSSYNFQMVVYDVLDYVNLFTNLIYALAVIWMPRKQVFTMPS